MCAASSLSLPSLFPPFVSAFLYSIFSPRFSPTPPSLLPPTPFLSLVNTQTTQSDVNECAQDLDNCQQLCNNTVGSFTCGCEIGYELDVDGFTCALNGTTGEAGWHSILCNHGNIILCKYMWILKTINVGISVSVFYFLKLHVDSFSILENLAS